MNTRTAVGSPVLVCRGRTPGRGWGSAQYVMCVWLSIIPGIPYNLERSTTGTLGGTAELPLPTDLTRSPSTTTTASVITLLPSQSLPNRIAVTSGDFWELAAEFCAGTARSAGIASKIDIKTVAISVFRIDAVLQKTYFTPSWICRGDPAFAWRILEKFLESKVATGRL